MITAIFLLACVGQVPANQHQLGGPDPLSSFRVVYQQGAKDYGEVDAPSALSLAHRLWQYAAFAEDRDRGHWENWIVVSPRMVTVRYRGRVGLSYARPTGRLFACGISYPSENRAPNLSIDQCVEKVKEYYRLVGGTNSLSLQRAEIDLSMDRETFLYVYVYFSFTAPGTAYRFASGIEAIVDRTYGTPENMQIGEIPPYDAPANVVSKDDAVANAIAAASQYTGWSVLEGALKSRCSTFPTTWGCPTGCRPSTSEGSPRERRAWCTRSPSTMRAWTSPPATAGGRSCRCTSMRRQASPSGCFRSTSGSERLPRTFPAGPSIGAGPGPWARPPGRFSQAPRSRLSRRSGFFSSAIASACSRATTPPRVSCGSSRAARRSSANRMGSCARPSPSAGEQTASKWTPLSGRTTDSGGWEKVGARFTRRASTLSASHPRDTFGLEAPSEAAASNDATSNPPRKPGAVWASRRT